MTDAATRARDALENAIVALVKEKVRESTGGRVIALSGQNKLSAPEIDAYRDALLESAAADRARLDWLENMGASVWCNHALPPETFSVEVDTSFMDRGGRWRHEGATVRDAIDAAMAAANARALADAFPVPTPDATRGTVTHGEDVNYVDS